MSESSFAPRTSLSQVENDLALAPRFDEHGLLPVVTTDAGTGEVLMFAYMNAEALQATIRTGEAHYWSRSRQELWHKGATSGHVQQVVELRVDCDQDSLWLKVDTHGDPSCHVGYSSCFYRSVPLGEEAAEAEPIALRQEAAKVYDPVAVYGEAPKTSTL